MARVRQRLRPARLTRGRPRRIHVRPGISAAVAARRAVSRADLCADLRGIELALGSALHAPAPHALGHHVAGSSSADFDRRTAWA